MGAGFKGLTRDNGLKQRPETAGRRSAEACGVRRPPEGGLRIFFFFFKQESHHFLYCTTVLIHRLDLEIEEKKTLLRT